MAVSYFDSLHPNSLAMNHAFHLSLACLLMITGTSVLGQTGEARVLVIGIDGTRPDCLEAAETPALDALIADGIYSPDALNNDITYSGPGWSAMICGVWSDAHGVTSNNFVGSDFEGFPSFMRRLELENPELNTHSILPLGSHQRLHLGRGGGRSHQCAHRCRRARRGRVPLGNGGDPHAVFLHFDDVDINGHGYGFNAAVPQYIGAIETTDGFVADVMEALTSRPNLRGRELVGVGLDRPRGHRVQPRGHLHRRGDDVFPGQRPLRWSLLCWSKTRWTSCPLPKTASHPEPPNCGLKAVAMRSSLQTAPALQLGADQDFTLEVRIRTQATPDVAIIGNKDWNTGLNPGFVFSFEYPSGPAWKVNIGDGNERADANGSSGVADGQWHTLSCSFDRDGMMRLYTDGVFSAEEDISDVGDIDVGSGWFFGSDILGAYSYTGAIAEVRFWHGVLAEEAISAWHCSSLDDAHPNWASLQGHWALTEGAGLEVSNSASSGLDWHRARCRMEPT